MTLHPARFPMKGIGTAGPSPSPLNSDARGHPLVGRFSRTSRIRERDRDSVILKWLCFQRLGLGAWLALIGSDGRWDKP
jgi:hypothetical protein